MILKRHALLQLCFGIVLAIAGLTCAQASWWHHRQSSDTGYTQTRYPIVLVHGLFGFDSIGPLQYWHGIPSPLRDGGAQVFVTQVAAANSNEVRGEQLLQQVEEIVATTGKAKVNLIGHSQGAPTARYVAGVRPDLVASVTTIGGVNRGSAVADLLADLQQSSPQLSSLVTRVTTALANLIDTLSGGGFEQDVLASNASLTTEGSAAFNQRFPAGIPSGCGDGDHEVNGIRYYSWTGTDPTTNVFDITDPFLALTALAFDGETDGLVGRCSAHLGKVIRDDYKQNHLDEVNQLMGLTAPFAQNPPELYREHANRLKQAGL